MPRPARNTGRSLLWILLLALSMAPGLVHAQAPANGTADATADTTADAESDATTDPPSTDAFTWFARAREHYQAGRYRQAATHLEKALALDPGSGTLLYNLGRVHELLGEIPTAIDYYRRYRRTLGSAKDRDKNGGEIDRMTEAIERLQGARKAISTPHDLRPLQGSDAEVTPPPRRNRATLWSLLALGGGSLAAAVTTGTLAIRERSQAEDFVLGKDGAVADRDRRVERSQRYAFVTDILLGSATAFGLGAVVFVSLEIGREVPPDAAPATATDQAGEAEKTGKDTRSSPSHAEGGPKWAVALSTDPRNLLLLRASF